MKKMKGYLRKLYYGNKRFIWTMTGVLLAGNIALFIKGHQQQKAFERDFPVGMEVMDFEAYMESQKNVLSDIEGLSVYDKYAKGLQRQDGSDSDYDGLTDKEEIEVYGTDPLKASTAGDLYTDAYKVRNGMDPFTYMEYTGEFIFPYLECEEVQLMASSPTDFNAVVSDCTALYDLSGFDIGAVYKGYNLYNYAGNIKINVHDIMADQNINEFEIYVANGPFIIPDETEFRKCAYKLEGDMAVVNYEFEYGNEYLIFLVEKRKFSINSIINSIVGKKNNDATASIDGREKGEALVCGSPWGVFFGGKITVYYAEGLSEKNASVLMNEAGDYATEIFGGKSDEKKYIQLSKSKLEDKRKFYEKFLKLFNHPGKGADVAWYELFFRYGIFCYSTYENIYTVEDEAGIDVRSVATSFDKYWDELPFQNFRSDIGTGGNCAGITHLTSYLYNTGSFPSSGEYGCSIDGVNQAVAWDLSADIENATLRDPGLFDYKTIDFIREHSDGGDYLNSGLTRGEQEFVNMVGCFWAEANDRIDMNAYGKATGEYYDVSFLNRMTSLLDQDKVLDVYLYMRSGGAHAVNIYGYEYVNERCVRFAVYDNNIPQDCKEGYRVNTDENGNCFLQMMIRKDGAGNDILEYLYMPLSGSKSYIASSMKNLMPYNVMVVMDENWNVLN